MTLYEQYIHEVSTGKKIVCTKQGQAIDRHLRDLKESKKKTFPYYFDQKEADRYVMFLKLIRLVEGHRAGEKFPIEPFQAFDLANIFGWKRKQGHHRKYTETYQQVPKKNAKTTTTAATAVAFFYLQNINRAQFYFAATSRDQANLCFDVARLMIIELCKEYPSIAGKTRVLTHAVVRHDTHSFMKSVSKEADNLEGKGGLYASADEYHLHRSNEVVDNMKSGMSLYVDPLMQKITTPGRSLTSVCYEHYEYCDKVLGGIIQDDHLYVSIHELDKKEDYHDPDKWNVANPNLGNSPTVEYLSEQYTKAINMGGSKLNDFLTKHMGLWVSTHSTWIQDEVWMELAEDFSLEDMIGRECTGGLDLASKHDLTAYTLFFPGTATEPHRFKTILFCPESKLEERKGGRIDYYKWWEEGRMIVTPGNVTDYEYIETYIMKSCELYNINYIEYDRWNSSYLVTRLQDQGANMEPFSMSIYNMYSPTAELEDMIYNKKIRHDGCPVFRWMMSNVQLKYDSTGEYYKPDKGESSDKIDGPVSLVMAIGGWMTNIGKAKEITIGFEKL